MKKLLLSGLIVGSFLTCSLGQHADLTTVDGIIENLYASISGPAGERDWDFFRSLFVPTATMGAMAPDPEGKLVYFPMTPDSYIDRNGPFFLKNGFWEKEIGREQQQYGELVHVYSAYEYRMERDGEEIRQRGINSIQLVRQDSRWWIVSLQWNAERDDLQVPKKLAKKG